MLKRKNIEYSLFKIPKILDIIPFLEILYRKDNHRRINSLRNLIVQCMYYILAETFLINYIIKICLICWGKGSKTKLKRES